jgi:hypothetical protein
MVVKDIHEVVVHTYQAASDSYLQVVHQDSDRYPQGRVVAATWWFIRIVTGTHRAG